MKETKNVDLSSYYQVQGDTNLVQPSLWIGEINPEANYVAITNNATV